MFKIALLLNQNTTGFSAIWCIKVHVFWEGLINLTKLPRWFVQDFDIFMGPSQNIWIFDSFWILPYFSVSQCQTSQNGYPCKFPFRFENRSHFECVKRRGSDIPECQVDRERVSWIFIFKNVKFNLHWHELWKQEKCLYITQGCFGAF